MYSFPKTLKVDVWVEYLGRPLTSDERDIIEYADCEREYNRQIRNIYRHATVRGLYIPKLTERDGNCLFESLQFLGLCSSSENLRLFIAHIMYSYRDCENLFDGEQRSLKQMFDDTNDVEQVLCDDELVIYKYTYETMCQDVATGCSWTRLPTQLIMMIICRLFNVVFEITSDSTEYVHVIGNQSATVQVVHIGHLSERHYIPLLKRQGLPLEDVCPKYLEYTNDFKNWAYQMQAQVRQQMTDTITQYQTLISEYNS